MKSLTSFWERSLSTLLALLMAVPANVVITLAQSSGTQITVNDGGPSRSVITNLTFTLTNGMVPVSDGVSIHRLPFGPPLDPAKLTLTSLDETNTYRLNFTNLPGNRLPDGNYLASLIATPETNFAGPRVIDSFSIFGLFGDQDGDRDVDFFDTWNFRETWSLTVDETNRFNPQFDADGDSLIGANDLSRFRSNYFTVLPEQPGVITHLETDDGPSPSDQLTTVATVVGQVFATDAATRVEAALHALTGLEPIHFEDISAELIDGRFRFDSNRLAELAGQNLENGPYEFSTRLVETNGAVSASHNLPFTLGVEAGCISNFWKDWNTEISASPDTAPPGSVTFVGCEAILSEGSSFRVSISRDLRIPEGAGVLAVEFQSPQFDGSSTGLMRDAFEIALVDTTGRPLTYTIVGKDRVPPASASMPPALPPNPDVCFNLTDSQEAVWAPGSTVQYQDRSIRLLIDVSTLGVATSARLILRLVNNDQDHGTSVRIANWRFGPATPALDFSGYPGLATVFGMLQPGSPSTVLPRFAPADASQSANSIRRQSELGNLKLRLNGLPLSARAGSVFSISGSVGYTNGASGTGRIELVTVNGVPVEGVDDAGNFFSTITIRPGRNTFVVTVRDSDDATASSEVAIEGLTGEGAMDRRFLTVVNASIEPQYGRSTYNEQTDVLYAELALRNAGTYPIRSPLYVGITISDPKVSLLAPDGLTSEGIPYLDFSGAISDLSFAPGFSTRLRPLAFHNPDQLPFTYDLVVLGLPNQAPQFTSSPVITATVGKPYQYDAIASDPDGDPVQYHYQIAPESVTLDNRTGSMRWTPTMEQLGNQAFEIVATDGLTGRSTQRFVVAVTEPQPNRPPVFVSTPGTVARATGKTGGILLVANDEWILSDSGFQNSPDGTTLFVKNITQLFTGVRAGSFLAYSRNLGLTGARLAEAVRGMGHSWTNDYGFPLTPDLLRQFDGVFAGGDLADNDVLVNYLREGGNVYLFGGSGSTGGLCCNGPPEAQAWSNLLAYAGLSFAESYNAVSGVIPIEDSPHPVFSGNPRLYQNIGQSIVDLDTNDNRGIIIASTGGDALYAVFDPQVSTGETYSYYPVVVDPDDDSVKLSLTSAPEGMWIDSRTGTIRWNPDSTIAEHLVTIQADDGRGGVAFQSYLVCVLPDASNHAPIIADVGPTQYVGILGDGNATTLQVTIRDFSTNHLDFAKFAGSRVRPGIVETNLGPDGKPVFAHPGPVETISGPDSFRQWFNDVPGVNQRTNMALTLTATPQNPRVFEFYKFDFQPINGQLGGNEGDTKNGLFTVEAHAQIRYLGGEVLNFASDDDLWVFLDGRLVIDLGGLHGEQRRQLHLDQLGLTQGQLYSLDCFYAERYLGAVLGFAIVHDQPPSVHVDYQGGVAAMDPDDDVLSYELVSGPLGLDVVPQTGELRWTADGVNVGPHSVTVRARDGRGGIDERSFVINVLEPGSGSIIGEVLRDLDGDDEPDLIFGEEGWQVYLDLNRNGRRDIGEPTDTTDFLDGYALGGVPIGEYSLLVEVLPGWSVASPPTGAFDIEWEEEDLLFRDFIVRDALDPNPRFVSVPGPQTVRVGSSFVYQPITRGFDSGTLRYELISPPFGMIVHTNTGMLAWRPARDDMGVHDVIIRASDGAGRAAIQAISVSVSPANNAPFLITSLPATAVVDQWYTLQLQAQDSEGHIVHFGVTNSPEGFTLNSTNGIISWTPILAQVGPQVIDLVAIDSEGDATWKTFEVEVRPSAPNSPPRIVTNPRIQTRFGSPWLYVARAIDLDANPLSFALVSGPEGMTLTNSLIGLDGAVLEPPFNGALFTWTPQSNQIGTNEVTIDVSDGRGGSSTQTFQVVVGTSLANSPPAIVSNPPEQATAGQTYEYDLVGADPDGDALQWQIVVGTVGASINPETGSLRWIPTLDQLGTNQFVVEVTDGLLGNDRQEFFVEVGCVNRPPNIVSTPPVAASKEANYVYAARASDPDDDLISWSLEQSPSGMTIDSTNGLVRWAVPADAVGPQLVQVRATDGRGGSDTQSYTLHVNDEQANKPPVITSTPSRGAASGQAYQYELSATDADGDVLSLQLLQAPAGATLLPGPSSPGRASGMVTWLPPDGLVGSVDFIVAAQDPWGASSGQRFSVTVRANEAPRITSTPRTNAIPEISYYYDVRAIDPDRDPLNYHLVQAPVGMTIDGIGRIQWLPGPGDLGEHVVLIEVADGYGGTTQQQFSIAVLPDNIPPVVTLNLISGFIQNGVWTGDLGSSISVQVKATDNVGVVEKTLRVGDQSYPLNAAGVATIPITTGGLFQLTGIARDAAGNVGSDNRPIQFYDPNAPNSFLVSILSPTNGAVISKKVPIVATISNAVPIVKYQVDFAPADQVNLNNIAEGNSAWTTLSEVTLDQPMTLLHAVTVATFDPLSLLNDSYVIRVYAQDQAGQGWYEPVVVGTEGDLKFGEFRIAFTDLTIPLSGIPVTVSRVYDSRLANRVGDFGHGWSLGLQDAMIRVASREGVVRPGARVYLTGPDGRRVGFTTDIRVTGGALFVATTRMFFRPDAGVFDRLEADGLDDVYFGRTSLGEAFGDEPTLNLARLITRDGTRYEYSRMEGLQAITDTSGNSIRYTRDGIFHFPAGSTNSDQSIRFVRDARGRIERIIDPAGLPLLYTYDAAGDLRAFTDQATNVTQYAYDSVRAHFLTNIVDPFGKNALGLVYENGALKEVLDAAGNPVQQVFDADQNIGTFTDARGTQTIVHFDDRGNETVRMIPGLSTNYFAYDENNNLISVTNANGYATNFVYDVRGNVTRITDALTNVTEIAYNELGKPTAVTNALGQVLRLQYNPAGQLTEVINNLGFVTRVGRDAQGRVTNLVEAVGNTNSFVYDGGCSCGRPGIVFNPDGSFRRYQYDAFGRTNLVVNELGATTRFNYAPDGRLLWVEDALTNRTTYLYDGSRLTNILDALGRPTQFRYDEFGRTNQIITAEGGTNEFRYDENGNRTHVIDPVGNVTRFVYDAANRVTNRIDIFNRTNHFVLDPMGNQIETIDRNGLRRTFAYDALGRLTNEVWWEGNTVVKSIVFGFNELGVQTLASDDVATYTYDYDSLNRLEQMIQTVPDLSDFRFALAYTYTPNGQVETVIDNWGVEVGSQYDNRNRLKTRTWQDTDNGIAVDEARVDFAYDAAGSRTNLNRYSDLGGTTRIGFTTNAYNFAGIVTNITHLRPAGQTNEVLARYEYEFDEAWQIRQWTINGQPSRFDYDRTGQLTNSLNTAQPNENFRYDRSGNRVGEQSGGAYVTNLNNQILSDGVHDYGYDLEGNMASRTHLTSGATTHYAWDHRNRLISVADFDATGVETQKVTFTYDAMNRRLSKTVNGQLQRFLYNGDDSWADLNEDGSIVTARYLHGARIDEMLARQRTSDGRGWYLTDHLGTVRDIANAAGVVVAHVDYSNFGQALGVSEPTSVDRFLFTGRELDEETRLYFYRNRYYSPQSGLFITQDPVGFAAVDYNLYRYAHNDPLHFVDSFGTSAEYSIMTDLSLRLQVAAINLYYSAIVGIAVAEVLLLIEWGVCAKRPSEQAAINTFLESLILPGSVKDIVVKAILLLFLQRERFCAE